MRSPGVLFVGVRRGVFCCRLPYSATRAAVTSRTTSEPARAANGSATRRVRIGTDIQLAPPAIAEVTPLNRRCPRRTAKPSLLGRKQERAACWRALALPPLGSDRSATQSVPVTRLRRGVAWLVACFFLGNVAA